jgi:hypothetical protein
LISFSLRLVSDLRASALHASDAPKSVLGKCNYDFCMHVQASYEIV